MDIVHTHSVYTCIRIRTCIGPTVLHCCVVVCMSYWSLTATPQHALSVLCICIGYIVYIMYIFYIHIENDNEFV